MTLEPLTPERRRQQTRDHLLQAAAQVFAERGFHGASLDDVAAAAGFTKGAVYSNFKNKEDLFLALLESRFASELEDLKAVLAQSEVGADDRLSDFVTLVVEQPNGPARVTWGTLYEEFHLYARRNPEARARLAELDRRDVASVAEILRTERGRLNLDPATSPEDARADHSRLDARHRDDADDRSRRDRPTLPRVDVGVPRPRPDLLILGFPSAAPTVHHEGVHRTVIIGAGFAGLAAARSLDRADVEVTLVDQRNFNTFLPLLYEVATAGLDPADVAYPIRASVGHAPNIRFRLGTVSAIDTDRREICFAGRDGGHAPGSPPCEDDIPYDSSIVASGVVANFFGVAGAAEYALPLYTLADARYLRDHILLRLEEADEQTEHLSDGTLTFAIVGGGPTGVEVAGAIAELLDMSVRRDGYRFDRSAERIVLVDGMEHVLTPFKDSAQRYAQETLEHRSVELRLGQFVSEVTPDSIKLADGTVLATRTVIWAGGVTVQGTVASTFGAPATRSGQLIVDSNLEVEGLHGVFAVGDAASIPLAPGSDGALPAARAGRHPVRQARGETGAGAGGRRPDDSVPLLRQGDHGHHRSSGCHRAAAWRSGVAGDPRLARTGSGSTCCTSSASATS